MLKQKRIDKKEYILYNTSTSTLNKIGSTKLFAFVSMDAATQRLKVDFWTITSGEFLNRADTVNKNSPDAFVIYKGPTPSAQRTTLGDPTRVYTMPYRGWSFGVNSIGFKYRTRLEVYDDTFALANSTVANINIGLNFGHTRGRTVFTSRSVTNYSASLMLFLGPTIADIKKETSKDPRAWTTSSNVQNLGALSTGLNVLFARNNLGLMFALGWDFALGKRHAEWLYSGKTWIGAGVAMNFAF